MRRAPEPPLCIPVSQRRVGVRLTLLCLQRHYEQYHGFVVIHGTDTMAFAASVLSFVLENLQKTLILTGAQVPRGGLRGAIAPTFTRASLPVTPALLARAPHRPQSQASRMF